MKSILHFFALCSILFSGAFVWAQAPVAALSPVDTTICIGDSLAFQDLSSGNITSSSWIVRSEPDTTYTIQSGTFIRVGFGLASGIGSDTVLRIVNGPGGTDTAMAIIKLRIMPTVDAGPDVEKCKDDPGIFFAGQTSGAGFPLNFEWTPSIGLNDSSLLNPFARPDTTTAYAFQAFYHGGGCPSNVDTLIFTVNENPKILLEDVSYCVGQDSGVLLPASLDSMSSSNPISFLWTPLIDLDDPTVLSPFCTSSLARTYTLSVFSINGCQFSDTVRVTPYQIPLITPLLDTAVFAEDTLLLEAFDPVIPNVLLCWGPDSLVDSLSSNIPVFISDSAGEFLLLYQGFDTLSGCKSLIDSIKVIVYPPAPISPVLKYSNQTDSVGITSASFDPNAQYTWWYCFFDGTLESLIPESALNLSVQRLMASTKNTGYIRLEAVRGPNSALSNILNIGVRASVDEPESTMCLRPNPAGNYIEIRKSQTPKSIEIFDLSGRLVMEIENLRQRNGDWIRYDLNGLKKGIYLFKAQSREGPIFVKFVKE